MSRRSGTPAAAIIPTRCARRSIAAEAGADGITAHLREDRRHITDGDIDRLMAEIDLPLNLEMAATEEMLADRARPPPARGLHRSRAARGAHDRGRARCRRPAQSPRLFRRQARLGGHPRQPVHRADRGAGRRRRSARRPGRRVPHRPLRACRRRGTRRRIEARSPTAPRSPRRTASSRTPATD